MDNELLNKIKACRTDADVRALLGEKRHLSESETEQVAGGWTTIEHGPTPGTLYLDGTLIDEAKFNSIFMSMTESLGFYTAANMLYEMTGFWCSEMGDASRAVVSSPAMALEQMDLVLNHFWHVMDGQ